MGEIIKKIRMVMNILFIIAAIILKFAESALRMMNVFNKPNEQ